MARKRVKEGVDRLSQLRAAAASFGSFVPASEALTEVRAVPTRFCQMDLATKVWGWPIERFTLVHGPSNHGKTLFVAGLMESFLAVDHFAVYVDAERTSPMSRFRKLMGERADHPAFFGQRPDSYEQVMADVRNWCNHVIREKEKGNLAPDVATLFGIDSLRKLVPKDIVKEILETEKMVAAGDISGGKDRRAQIQAKMNAAWMDEVVPLLEKSGSGMVAIAREMTDPDADAMARKWGNDYKVGGGGAIYYDSSLVVRVERAGYVQHGEGKDRKVYGERHRCTIKKTKVGGKDDKVAVAYFHSSNGTLTREGFDRGRVEAAGQGREPEGGGGAGCGDAGPHQPRRLDHAGAPAVFSERQHQLPALAHGVGAEEQVAAVGQARRRRIAIEPLARVGDAVQQRLCRCQVEAGRPGEACGERQRPADLDTARSLELRRGHDGADDLCDLVGRVGLLGPDRDRLRHQLRRCVFADQAHRQLAAEMTRRRRVACHQVQHLAPVGHARLERVEFGRQHALLIAVVPGLDIGELAGVGQFAPTVQTAAVLDRPAGEGAGALIDVLVDISRRLALQGAGYLAPAVVFVVEVDLGAERVQLEQFPAEILVGRAGARGFVG